MSDYGKRYGVIAHHPSRAAAARAVFSELRDRLARERPGYLLWCLDDPPDPVLAFAAEVPRGATFQVVPLLFAPGAHFEKDVQGLAADIRAARPDLDVLVCPPLLQDEAFLAAFIDRR